MAIFRITVCVPGCKPYASFGLFNDGFEAATQTHADWPQATGISVIHIATPAHAPTQTTQPPQPTNTTWSNL